MRQLLRELKNSGDRLLPAGTFHQQYVYGPGYVDELLAICDSLGGSAPRYVLQDANYNVMAVVNGAAGVATGERVIAQWQYSPYGVPRVAERRVAAPAGGGSFGFGHFVNSAGHQGLFFDRLDGDAAAPGLTTDADGVYYNRARTLLPRLGRFAQADVNASGLPLAALALNGQPVDALLDGFDPQGHYGDGPNLYAYAGANPANARDPAGLFFSLGDITASAGSASRAYGMYDAASSTLDVFKAFAAGVSAQNILLGLALEVAADKAGGKLLDNLVDFAAPMKDAFAKQFGKGWMQPFKDAKARAAMRPSQNHHMGTIYGKRGDSFRAITDKYGLDLDDGWNIHALANHQGRHPNGYHEWMLDMFRQADERAGGNASAFLAYLDNVFNIVKKYPEVLVKEFWK